MNLDKKHFIKELWFQFEEALEKNWEVKKYGKHGRSLSEVKNLTNFSKRIHKDIRTFFENKGEKIKIVGPESIYRYFKQKEISHAKDYTLEMLSKYLGYKSWGNFQQLNQKKIESQLQNANNQTNPNITVQKQISKNKWLKAPLSAIAIIFLIGLLFKFCKKEEKVDFRSLIENANQVEFDAYQASPRIDTSKLDSFFTSNGMARIDITGSLYSLSERGATLLTPPSSFSILEFQLEHETNNEIKIHTKEKWKLLWCYPRDSLGMLYDELNEQDYYLKKENGDWKINVNHYEGRAIRPLVPPDCD